MYNTSELYRAAIEAPVRDTYIDGMLTTAAGVEIPVRNSDIAQGSFYETNQCVNSDSFAYGAVFTAEMGVTLKAEIDRYTLYDAKIQMFFNILVRNGTYERLPLGVFYIDSPNRVGKNISIKAYDGMSRLDMAVIESTTGNVHDLLALTSERCGILLAQSHTEVSQLINSDTLLSLEETRVDTYRDLVSYLAFITCSFAIFDREGKLRLCQYSTANNKTVTGKLRTAGSFSDFETYYSAVTARFLDSGVYHTYISEGAATDGLVYDMGDIPIVQGLGTENQKVLDKVFSVLSGVRYVPADFSFPTDPSIDLGDMVTNTDRNGNSMVSLVTYYKWTYRGAMQLKSAGKNPKLARIRDNTAKELANLEQTISGKTVAVYKYTNASAITLKGGGTVPADMKEVIRIPFATTTDTTTLLMATIPFTLDLDGTVEFLTYIDAVYYDASAVKQYCNRGANLVTFMNYIDVAKNTRYILQVYMRTSYEADSDIRIAAAGIATNANAADALLAAHNDAAGKIAAGVNDALSRIAAGYNEAVQLIMAASELPVTGLPSLELPVLSLPDAGYEVVPVVRTVPTARIEAKALKATIFGQGLAGKEKWDGTLAFEEFMGGYIPLGGMAVMKGFAAEVGTQTVEYESPGFAESFGAIPLGGITVAKDMAAEYSITTQDVESGG